MPSGPGRSLLVALAAIAGMTTTAPAFGAAAGPLPDLDQEAPAQLQVARVRGGDQQWWLGFSSAVSNVGAGPFTIAGHRPDTSTPTMVADQVVAGSTPEVIAGVGRLRYVRSPTHEHWHLLGFERYALRRAGSTRAVVTDRKSGFCLGDRYRVTGRAVLDVPPQPVITGRCGLRQPSLLQIEEGISVGYGDVYGAYLEYQDLPLDGLPEGRYVLVHSVNVDGRIHETSQKNDSASVLLDIHWGLEGPTVTQLRSCPDSADCPHVPKRRAHAAMAHASGGYVPNDPGATSRPGGWSELQWNFAGPFGVGAPEAWQHVIDAGAPGGAGVTVAVLDTGVTAADRSGTRRSPDLASGQFAPGYDFVDDDRYPSDSNGHGTFVSSTIAERTGNGYALTGLAYGARLMPVRVLDAAGNGDPTAIARGVRFAARHGARVINMSFNFDPGVGPSQVPQVAAAIGYAHRRGVIVVAASGNDGTRSLPYPAADRRVLAVGATTEHGCAASFSDQGTGIDLVAPGGGSDADLPGDARCVAGRKGRAIAQLTLAARHPDRFAIGVDYEGTSMAAPHAAAAAALLLAGGSPSPDAVVRRLESTARDLGAPGYDPVYGWGLLDAAAATAR